MLKLKKKTVVKPPEKKRLKWKLNKNVFDGFLMSMSAFLFLLSFAFAGIGNLITLCLSLLCALGVLGYAAWEKICGKEYTAPEILMTAASLWVFFTGRFYQGIWMVLVYCLAKAVLHSVLMLKPALFDVAETVTSKKYHFGTDFLAVEQIKRGTRIELFSGETVPVDGKVIAGSGTMTLSAVTGDAKTFDLHAGDRISAGSALLSGNIILEAADTYENSSVNQSVHLLQGAQDQRTDYEQKAPRIWMYYTIGVLVIFLVYTIVCCVKEGSLVPLWNGVPLAMLFCCIHMTGVLMDRTFATTLYGAADKGVVIRNRNLVEKGMFLKNVLLGHQGVLTVEVPEVEQVQPLGGITAERLLRLATLAQCMTRTPVAQALIKACEKEPDTFEIEDYYQFGGGGAAVQLKNGDVVITGTAALLRQCEISTGMQNDASILCVAVNDQFVGSIAFCYAPQENVQHYVDNLRYAGVKELAIISGSSQRAVRDIAERTGIEGYCSCPDEELLQQVAERFAKHTLYVGSVGGRVCLSMQDPHVLIGDGGKKDAYIDGTVTGHSLIGVLHFLSLLKDAKRMLLENWAVGILCKVMILILFLNFSYSALLGVLLLCLIDLLTQVNCFRYLKKF